MTVTKLAPGCSAMAASPKSRSFAREVGAGALGPAPALDGVPGASLETSQTHQITRAAARTHVNGHMLPFSESAAQASVAGGGE